MSVTTVSIIERIRGLIKDTEKSDGRDAFVYDNDSSFSLSESYVNATGIKVFVNGTEILSFTYNSITNKVTITSGMTKDDNIIIVYAYYGKYSDTEITSYISANLTRFTQKKYKKTFYMNDSNKIVAVNNEDPTRREGDIIALITAIDIDPQNINVKIGNDFAISATENKAKSELINNVLHEFMRSYGVIDFLEIED